jgi:1,4-dihydroxy-2-naphthoate octaprenyltransferase
VRVGDQRTRVMYAACPTVALLCVLAIAVSRPWALIALLAAPLAVPPVRRVVRGAGGRDLVPVLQDTGRLQLVFGVLLAIGISL